MIYFDNCATSKYKPKCMLDSMIEALMDSSNIGRGAHNDSIDMASKVLDTRFAIKELLHANDDYQVIFTKNTTEALNLAIIGYLMNCKGKIHVITTAYEHNSVLRPLKYLANIGKIDVTILPIKDGDISIASIEMHIHNNTRLIAINHASNVTGSIQDIALASEISRAYNIPLLVDTAQSLGHTKINLHDTPITMLAGAGHKGLHGPQGTGFLVINTSLVDILPLMYGGTGTNSNLLNMPIEYPDSFEVGTVNAPSIIGLGSSIKWTKDNWEVINNCINQYSHLIYSYLSSKSNITLYSKENSNVISFNIDGYSSYEIADFLNENNIAVRSGLHCAPLVHTAFGTLDRGMVRISPGYNNTLSDIDLLIEALDRIPQL